MDRSAPSDAPGAVPDFEAYSPPMSAGSWLARNHVDARQESALVAKRVEIALEKQLEASSMQDLRVEALFLCLLKVASKPPGNLDLLDELSRAVGDRIRRPKCLGSSIVTGCKATPTWSRVDASWRAITAHRPP